MLDKADKQTFGVLALAGVAAFLHDFHQSGYNITRRGFLFGIGSAALAKGYFYKPDPKKPSHRNEQPIYIDPNPETGFFKIYLSKRGDLGAEIKKWQSDSHFHPRLKYFAQLTAKAGKIPDSLLKASFINGAINSIISYDHEKSNSKRSDLYPEWYQPTQQTLILGKDVCVGYALTKYEALLHSGFSQDDVHLYRVKAVDKKTREEVMHLVVAVNINNELWVLNNQSVGGNISPNERRGYFQSHSQIETAHSFFSLNGDSSTDSGTIYTPICYFNETSYQTCVAAPPPSPQSNTYYVDLDKQPASLVRFAEESFVLRNPSTAPARTSFLRVPPNKQSPVYVAT